MPVKKETQHKAPQATPHGKRQQADANAITEVRDAYKGILSSIGAISGGAKVGVADQQTAAKIQMSAAVLSGSRIKQVLGATNLTAALAPKFMGEFMSGGLGSGFMAGLQGLGLGDIVGKLTGNETTGGILGGAVGALVAGPIGLVTGIVGGFFGGRKSKRRRRNAKKAQAEAIEEQNIILGEALEGFAKAKDEIDRQLNQAVSIATINMDIITQNAKEVKRVANIKTESIKSLTQNFLGQQKVAFSSQGFGRRGSSWFVLGETESMGEKKQQEVRYELENHLRNFALQRADIILNMENIKKEADYANFKIGMEVKSKTREIGQNIKTLSDNSYARQERLERSKALMNFGGMIASGKEKASKSGRREWVGDVLLGVSK